MTMAGPDSAGAPPASGTPPKVVEPCVARSEPLPSYLARLDHVSSSVLRRFARTGAVASALQPVPPVPPEASLGDALHALLLEPERLDTEYFLADRMPPSANPPTEEELARRIWLSARDCRALAAMQRAVLSYAREPLADWLREGRRELSIYWSEADGSRWKARPDCFGEDVLLEFKTSQDPRARAFAKVRRHFGYDLQAAHYLEAVERLTGQPRRFLYVAVESVRPHSVWVHEMTPDELATARANLARLKVRYREAAASLQSQVTEPDPPPPEGTPCRESPSPAS